METVLKATSHVNFMNVEEVLFDQQKSRKSKYYL
jgi:hypothetical protein